MIRTTPQLPDPLRRIALCEFLPEILHDLNNEAAVLEGTAVLLRAGASDVASVLDRAAVVGKSADSCERVSWLACAVSAALGADTCPGERDDALPLFLEVAASAIRRRGGSGEPELPKATAVRDPLLACAIAAALRHLAGPSVSDLAMRVESREPAVFRLELTGGKSPADAAEILRQISRSFRTEITLVDTDDGVRALRFVCAA